MTPPDDGSGQYGVPYLGTGHDAFGAQGVGHGQPYVQQQYDPGTAGFQHGAPPQPPGYGSYPAPEAYPDQPARPYPSEEPGHVKEPEETEPGPLIRPFAMTGGRTRPRYELAIEALVSTSVDASRVASLMPEHRRICSLCTEVKSIAEVSALAGVPLGVARILVADLAEAGLVTIHQPAAGGESGNQPDVTLLERVLSGLRKL